nr:MAG TPA: hypothetical protein [Caudoviricetes sp.]
MGRRLALDARGTDVGTLGRRYEGLKDKPYIYKYAHARICALVKSLCLPGWRLALRGTPGRPSAVRVARENARGPCRCEKCEGLRAGCGRDLCYFIA